jgi:hypothetical protein
VCRSHREKGQRGWIERNGWPGRIHLAQPFSKIDATLIRHVKECSKDSHWAVNPAIRSRSSACPNERAQFWPHLALAAESEDGSPPPSRTIAG